MKVHLSRRYRFSASHRLHSAQLGEDENRRVYGKCNNPYGHGHNYVLEVTLEGEPNPVTGMVFDLRELKEILNQEVIDPMDHRFLNREVPPFDRVVPTTENLAIEIWKRLAGRIGGNDVKLRNVHLQTERGEPREVGRNVGV